MTCRASSSSKATLLKTACSSSTAARIAPISARDTDEDLLADHRVRNLPDGLVPNLLAFNAGVEIGQLLALTAILIAMGFRHRSVVFWRPAYSANVAVMTVGFVLIGYRLTGYFINRA